MAKANFKCFKTFLSRAIYMQWTNFYFLYGFCEAKGKQARLRNQIKCEDKNTTVPQLLLESNEVF